MPVDIPGDHGIRDNCMIAVTASRRAIIAPTTEYCDSEFNVTLSGVGSIPGKLDQCLLDAGKLAGSAQHFIGQQLKAVGIGGKRAA